MSTYVIGDLQGCLEPLKRLLDKLDYDERRDTLYFVGDLVNRGPASLECLRFVRSLGKGAHTVLGNHDLHLLATIYGIRKPSPRDTLTSVLSASNREKLEYWLREQRLMLVDKKRGFVVTHAGIYPYWTRKQAKSLARETSRMIRSDAFASFLPSMYGNEPLLWRKSLSDSLRWRFTINAFTRMRYVDACGRLDYEYSGPPAYAPAGLRPWYLAPGRKAVDETIVFGHWSAHPAIAPQGIIPVDRGCVWGGTLAAWDAKRQRSLSVFNR